MRLDESWIRYLGSGFKGAEFQGTGVDLNEGVPRSLTFTVNPEGVPDVNYYRFPGGVEAKDVTQHLTSFGGQAAQYIIRSCRLDGNNKGERVKDLLKAVDLIRWEIERIQNEDNN